MVTYILPLWGNKKIVMKCTPDYFMDFIQGFNTLSFWVKKNKVMKTAPDDFSFHNADVNNESKMHPFCLFFV